jgi:signal transduction histidine kinase/CheY-like chemotaxis protein
MNSFASRWQWRQRLSVRWKMILPFVLITLFVLLILLPMMSRLIERRFEADADRRLTQNALSVASLLERSQRNVQLSASFVANLDEIVQAGADKERLGPAMGARREELGLQELSYYVPDFEAGDPAFFYTGPLVVRRLQISADTQAIRDALILSVIEVKTPNSGIAIAPQSSQIIGVAPVMGPNGNLQGVILAVFYLDASYIQDISQILGVNVALVKDNDVIASTIDPSSDYESLIKAGFIPADGQIAAQNIMANGAEQERLLAHPLMLNGTPNGSVLVAKSTQDVQRSQADLQNLLLAFAAILVLMSLVFGFLSIVSFAQPLARLTAVTDQVRAGDLTQRVPEDHWFFRDEVADLNRNFNAMVGRLQDVYLTLEERIQERTAELVQERNKLNETLQDLADARDLALAATRAKSAFLANMSHELRTPLNAIIGYTNLVLSGVYGEIAPKQTDRLQRVVDNGYHLLNLINDILDLSKIEAGKMELYLETFEVANLLENVNSTVRPLMAKKNNHLVSEIDPNIGHAFADLTKVRQILFNLLSNAAKFTENGQVTLIAERLAQPNGDQIRFRVKDSGIGMTDEQLSKIFQEFSQADNSTTRKYGGTGLGLTITRHFCSMMGGTIQVSSQLGVGSTFEVVLPAQVRMPEAPTEPVIAITDDLPASAEAAQNSVLVIDDDATARDLIEHYLTEQGYSVYTADNGALGLAMAKQYQPRIITLDVMMSNMDGWAVLTSLKRDPQVAHIPVVMLTIVDEKNTAYALGASDYVTKPIDSNRLVEVLYKYRQGDGPSYSVLVVEDETDTRKMMAEMLTMQGWEVLEAENGRVALERLSKAKPSVILLDLMMPEMDGFEFVETVRRHETLRAIPIVVVTAMSLSQEDRMRLDGYIRKIVQKGHFTPDSLLQEIRTLLRLEQPV